MSDQEKLVTSVLYTTEAEKSKQKVEEELKVPDPDDAKEVFAELIKEKKEYET